MGLAVVASACRSEGQRTTSGLTVRDSAGVEMVEAPREVIEALPEWSLQVDLDLGGVDADAAHALFLVDDVRVLDDGTLVVVNVGSREILFFDPEIPALRIQVDMEPSGSGVPIVEELGGLSQQDGRYLLQNVRAGTYTVTT